jgi:membrane-associated phospholipid phosphatase
MTEFRFKVWLTAALIALDAGWIALGGFSFDMASLAACLGFTALLASVGFVYTRLRPDEKLGIMGTETAFLTIFSAAACVFSYLMTSTDRPLIDTTLAHWDADLGFNWYHYVAFANAHPIIGALSSAVYQTTLLQIALSVVVLPLLGHLDRVREMVLLVMASSLLCVIISAIVPSEGALAYFHPPASFYMQNHPVVDMAYKQAFFDIRDGALTHFGLTDLKGLVAFPSYHVALSAILMIAFRGIKGWFWPVAVFNTLVILSTPIDGGHHLTDGIGGFVLALATAAVITRARTYFRKPATAEISENIEGFAGQEA